MVVPRNSISCNGVSKPTSLDGLKETPNDLLKVVSRERMCYNCEKDGAAISTSST